MNDHSGIEEAEPGLDIVDIIGQYMQLKRVGKVFKGCCPFHESDGKGQQQSLVVWPETQTFNCFKPGCKANVKSRRLGYRQGILNFLELMEETPKDTLPEPAQQERLVKRTRKSKDIARTLPLPFIEPEPLFSKISYSMLESYQLCPLRFKRQYVERQSVETTSFSRRLGSSIHITLSKFYSLDVRDRTISVLHQLLDENWQVSPHDVEEDTYWHERAHEMLESFFQSEGASVNPIALESSFKFPVDDFWIFGRVDRVDQITTGQYEVIDYKVLRGDPRDEREAMSSLQSVCLFFGAQSLFRVFPSKITYLHLDTGERVSFTPVRSKMENELSEIKKLVRKMQEAADFPATRNRFCSACQLYRRCPATR